MWKAISITIVLAALVSLTGCAGTMNSRGMGNISQPQRSVSTKNLILHGMPMADEEKAQDVLEYVASGDDPVIWTSPDGVHIVFSVGNETQFGGTWCRPYRAHIGDTPHSGYACKEGGHWVPANRSALERKFASAPQQTQATQTANQELTPGFQKNEHKNNNNNSTNNSTIVSRQATASQPHKERTVHHAMFTEF
jgi:hypothetical protein